jgi:hypothetical protein
MKESFSKFWIAVKDEWDFWIVVWTGVSCGGHYFGLWFWLFGESARLVLWYVFMVFGGVFMFIAACTEDEMIGPSPVERWASVVHRIYSKF